MMKKRYKITLAALTPQQQESLDALLTGGAAKHVTEIKKEVEKFKNLDPGSYEQNLKEIVEKYTKEENVTNEIATKLGLTPNLATAYINDFIAQYNLGRPDAIDLLSTALSSASSFGFQREEAIDYLRVLLDKFKNPETVAQKITADFKSMQELAVKTDLYPKDIFNIFYDALLTNNFAPVWAMVAVVPLLKINWLNKDASNMKSIAAESIPLIEKFQGIALPLSQRGSIVNSLAEAANAMKNAFNPILDYLAETMISRQISFYDIAKMDFTRDQNTFKSIYDYHNKLDADFANLQARRDMVNRKSILAPGPEIGGGDSKNVKSNLIKKYKIVSAAPTSTPAPSAAPTSTPAPSATPTSTPAPSATPSTTPSAPLSESMIKDERRVRLGLAYLTNLDVEIDFKFKSIEEFLTPAAEGISGDIITSFFDLNQAELELQEVIKLISEFKTRVNQIHTIAEKLFLDPALEGTGIETKVEENLNSLELMIKKSTREHETKLKKIQIQMLAAPYIKEYEDKFKQYSEAKTAIGSPSNKLFVTIVEVDPVTNKNVRYEIPRQRYINMVGDLGEQCVSILRNLASFFYRFSDANSKRTANRINGSAVKLDQENRKWISESLNPFTPLVGEPR